MAFKEGIAKAKPVILEPYVTMKVLVDDEFTGDIMGDFNKKRGRVINVDHQDDKVCIEAQIPQNEIMNYSIDLKAMTQGQGTYSREFLDYEIAPDPIAKKVIEARKK